MELDNGKIFSVVLAFHNWGYNYNSHCQLHTQKDITVNVGCNPLIGNDNWLFIYRTHVTRMDGLLQYRLDYVCNNGIYSRNLVWMGFIMPIQLNTVWCNGGLNER